MATSRESLAFRPGLGLGDYPEREPESTSDFEWLMSRLFRRAAPRERTPEEAVATIREYGESLGRMPDEVLGMSITGLRMRFTQQTFDDDLAMQAFAHVREVSGRVLGMYHHDTQLLGGWVMYTGKLALMQTGEGKTLTATLPACAAAMAGIPVHVITANDYLAERDAESMMPVYEYLGLSVGVIREDLDFDGRQAAYGCDVAYCTNKQIAFDYLRDGVARGGRASALHSKLARIYDRPDAKPALMLRGLCYAVIDEADSVLIDEARTPLVLSRPVESAEAEDPLKYRQALDLAAQLDEGEHFELDPRSSSATLTEAGEDHLDAATAGLHGVLSARREREELVRQALAAIHLYIRDRQYVVRDDRVLLVDNYSGRLMADRSWGQGLQQLVEVKEGCTLSGHKETLARISYQRFFGRYLKLSGMTGTTEGLHGELARVYGLEVVAIPTFKPSKRIEYPERVFATAEDKFAAIATSAAELAASGRAVLIGTRSILTSEMLGQQLAETGVDVQVLNARQDKREAELVGRAGQPGRVTVATSMAGRGTDIPLVAEIKEADGLHVIVASRNESRRVDRQLIGRCARQGDPGSYQLFGSLDDSIPQMYYPAWLLPLLRLIRGPGGRLPRSLGRFILNLAQRGIERKYRRARSQLQRQDEALASTLAFSGERE